MVRVWSLTLLLAGALSAACSFDRTSTSHSPTAPSSTGAGATPSGTGSTAALTGTWSTAPAPALAITPGTCANLQWTVTTQSPTQLAGSFSAECAGGTTLSGQASGQLSNPQSIPITVQGTGSLPGVASCPFSATGTGSVIDSGSALQIVYSGTTCLGPIHGTETLRKKSSGGSAGDTGSSGTGASGSTTAGSGGATGSGAPSGSTADWAPDQMNLGQAVVYNSPADVASWPITTHITRIEMLGCNGGVAPTFAAQNRWPDYTPSGWDGPLQYTLWAVVNVNGQWNTSGFIQFWRGRENTGAPILPLGCGFPVNWAYDARWGPMNGYRPHVGEQMGFFVTAGDARNQGGPTSVRERSNVVVVNLPSDYGTFTW
jgi:hypothetical protein